MRFNSARTGNYARSAQLTGDSVNKLFAENMKGPDFTAISKAAMDSRSMERRAAMKAEAEVSSAGLAAFTKATRTKNAIESQEKINDIKRPAKRMAGIVGGLGALATGYVGMQENKKAKAERDELRTMRDELSAKQLASDEASAERFANKIADFRNEIEGSKPNSKPNQPVSVETGATTTPAVSSTKTSFTKRGTIPKLYSSKRGVGNVDISKLTDDDFNNLAYAISSEAGPGKDRYGVAASIINRVGSDKFPSSVKDVIYSPGQYEGVYKRLSSASPDIAADLKSDKGRAELQKALTVLDGRTDFKGQSQLQHRSSKGNKDGMLDPMFDPKGNFFHYSHQ